MGKVIEVKWAEPKGNPEELLVDLDDVCYANRVTTGNWLHNVDYIHVNLKNGSDLLLADGEKLYNLIKKEKMSRLLVEESPTKVKD